MLSVRKCVLISPYYLMQFFDILASNRFGKQMDKQKRKMMKKQSKIFSFLSSEIFDQENCFIFYNRIVYKFCFELRPSFLAKLFVERALAFTWHTTESFLLLLRQKRFGLLRFFVLFV